MRSELHRNQVTDAQTVHENLNGVSVGTHEVEDSKGYTLARLEVVLQWLGSAVAVAFIGLAIIAPERIERTLTSLMFKAPNIQNPNASDISLLRVKPEAGVSDIKPGFEVRWSAVEMAKSDRTKQIDAKHEFNVLDHHGMYSLSFLQMVSFGGAIAGGIGLGMPLSDSQKASPPQVTDDFDQRSRSQTETTGSASIPTPSAAGSIDIDQSLAIEFPVAAYEPHKSADEMKRRAKKVAAKRSVYGNPNADPEAGRNLIEQPPSRTSAY